MKIVTSITAWNDAVGQRVSITYSEIDEQGKIISDNKRFDRVVTDNTTRSHIANLMAYAQNIVDNLE